MIEKKSRNSKVHEVLKSALATNKTVGHICASTSLLGFSGNFSGTDEPLAKGRRVVGVLQSGRHLKSLGSGAFY